MVKLKAEEWWMDEALYDSWQFEEMIEQLEGYWFKDTCKTLGNQLRLVFWYTLYMFCIHDQISDTVVHFVHKKSSKYFTKATKITQGSLGVQIMDPYQMVELRYRILMALQQQQEKVINPFIIQYLQERSPKMPLIEFGARHLRCWIDLIIRFINVPMRIQATKEMHLGYPFRKTDASEHHVARLLYENGIFTRLFMFDKVGKTGAHRPIRCPLPEVISPYLLFYIKYCRTGDSSFVFVNPTGSTWKQASRDIKHYLESVLDIQADLLDPSGRFIHGSRSIMLANYALRVKFDPLRLQQFATLMRHSFGTMNAYYLLWTDWATAKIAMNDFNKAFGLSDSSPNLQDFSQFDVSFSYPKSVVEDMIASNLVSDTNSISNTQSSSHLDSNLQSSSSVPDTQSASLPESVSNNGVMRPSGNLTGSVSDGNGVMRPSGNKKRCEKCRGEMRIYGPYGKKKHPKQYCCYWYQCSICVPPHKEWIPFGFMTEYSCSRKSKYHDEIIQKIIKKQR